MPRLALHSVHEAACAVFVQVGGWEVPACYGDVASEYRAIREAAGIADRSARGKLRVTGSDRVRFLHGMLSNTVEGLGEGEGNYATLTNPKGQTLTDVWVHHRGESFVLETEPGFQEKLYTSLDRYLIADDVEMQDITESLAILGVQGPRAGELVSEIFGGVPTDLPEYHTVIRSFNGTEVMVVSRAFAGESGYDLWVAVKRAEALWSALEKRGGRPAGFEALEVLRVEAGIPRYGVDVDERATPLEAGLYSAVDFEKGCYVGQEVIAKMHNLGKPRRYLVGLCVEADTPPAAGAPVWTDGKEIGHITSGLRSLALDRVVALASVRRGFQEPGQVVFTEGGVQAEVVALPFYKAVPTRLE